MKLATGRCHESPWSESHLGRKIAPAGPPAWGEKVARRGTAADPDLLGLRLARDPCTFVDQC